MKIEIRNVSKSFGEVPANRDVSLTIEAGTIHGLLGENGAGKTTLMKVLSGYLAPDSGDILLDGRPARFRSPADALAAGIGMLHQDPLDVPQMTVLENYELGRNHSLLQHRRAARSNLSQACQRFGFSLSPDEPLGALTVGERQQLELVRLLSMGVRTVILDEPTTGISDVQKITLFATLRDLASEGLSVILVTHKLEDVHCICDHVSVLRAGQLVGSSPAPMPNERLVTLMFGHDIARDDHGRHQIGETCLEVKGMGASSHRLTLNSIQLSVRRGEVVGLAGLEGSGQQLFMRACAGLVPIHAGDIVLQGTSLRSRSYGEHLAKGIAYVPAARMEEGLIGEMTLLEHFALVGDSRSFLVPWQEASAAAQDAISDLHIVGTEATKVQDLSGGNQQRALLGLLSPDLTLLLLEHPTRGLDVSAAVEIWARLHERCRQGTTIIFSSADLDELLENSDRIVAFSGGKMASPRDADDLTVDELGHLIGGVCA